ncbi:unnamed protein product [Ectocarpus sp. 4 AP-2014]
MCARQRLLSQDVQVFSWRCCVGCAWYMHLHSSTRKRSSSSANAY